MICLRLTSLLLQLSPLPSHSDASSVEAEKDPVFVNLGGTADLICVADANPIIPGMFFWKWLVSATTDKHTHTSRAATSKA